MGRYKHGKIQEALTFQQILDRVREAGKKVNTEQLSYFWLLYYSGVRKSELYERVCEDIQITEESFIIDFHQRKKHGAEVPPLAFPLQFPGINKAVDQWRKMSSRRGSLKLIERYDHGERSTKRLRAHWMFPNIHRTSAATLIKTILGENYYPHFLRLNRITEMCSDPELNLSRLKSYTGIKSLDALQSYMGISKREQKAAIQFMAKQIQKEGDDEQR